MNASVFNFVIALKSKLFKTVQPLNTELFNTFICYKSIVVRLVQLLNVYEPNEVILVFKVTEVIA